MRKVKVLALLLAALMVVAVFAGCADTDAIVADVENLDERVEALENLLNNQKDAIDDVKDQLGDVSDKLDNDTTAAQLEAVLKALEEQQKANAALQEQLKELGDKVTKVEEDNKESDENADDDAALQAAVKVYTAKLQELKITCELSKDDYVLADYEAVVKALTTAINDLAAAETEEAAKKVYDDAVAVYNAKATVYTKLINYYNSVLNAITVDSKDLIAEIDAYINDKGVVKSVVNEKYWDDTTTPGSVKLPEKITAYATGKTNADGTAEKVNLVTELNNAIAAYNYLVAASAGLKAEVNEAMVAIKAIGTVKINPVGIALVDAAKVAYKDVTDNVTGNTVNAKYLADSNLALVENASVLTDAIARLNQLTVAKAMYGTLGTTSGGKFVSVFAEYTALPVKVDYQEKAVYDAINATLKTWVDTYALDDDNVEIIVNEAEVDDATTPVDETVVYATYKAENHKVNLYAKAYADFAAIANRVTALNKVTVLDTAAFNEYAEITKAIEAWKTVQKEDKTVTPNVPKIDVDAYNMAHIFVAYGLVNDKADATITATDLRTQIDFTATDLAAELVAKKLVKADNYFGLYCFADTKTSTFFATTYAEAKLEASFINESIKTLKDNLTAGTKYTDIARHLAVEGLYRVTTENSVTAYRKQTPTATDTCDTFKYDKDKNANTGNNGKEYSPLTIEAFKLAYTTADYDLSTLINLADFEAAKAGAIERIAGFKAGAENIAKLVEAIDYVELKEGANAYDFSVPADGDTVYYYVNLSDAEAIDAANKAYTAWINSGANSDLAEWVPYVDPTTEEVVPDTYVFETIADEEVLAALKQMNERVAILKSMAAKLVAHYELVAEVWDEIKATVDLAADANTKEKDVLALHQAVLDAGSITVDGKKTDGAYPVTLSNASANSFSYNGTPYKLAAKGAAVAATDAIASSATLEALIKAGNDAYEAFMTMNRNITLKSNGTAIDKKEYVKDSAVEAAVKGIAAAELVMVKDAALDAVANATGLTEGQKAQYTEWLNGATAVQGYTGATVWVYAQQIYAQSGLRLDKNNADMNGYLTRGTEIVSGKIAAYVFSTPSYDNIG